MKVFKLSRNTNINRFICSFAKYIEKLLYILHNLCLMVIMFAGVVNKRLENNSTKLFEYVFGVSWTLFLVNTKLQEYSQYELNVIWK